MELSFFLEMAWKSALIAGAALALAMLLRSRAAADRAMVLRIGVAMLLALPLIVTFLPALEIVAFAAPAAPPPLAYVPAPEVQLAALAGELPPAPVPTIWDDPTPLVLLAYLGGLAMVGARLLAGLYMLRRWTKDARDVTCPDWLAAFDRVRWSAGDPEKIRLMVSDGVKSPLSWGWRRPVILIDPDTLDEPDDAEAILAHEVAHVARGDWPMLMLARIAATLFWFNPLVWWLEREIVQQAEEAADLEAAERVDPARYAETLLSWARFNGMVPANSIAPTASALGRRVRAVLDRGKRERPAGSAWTGIAIMLCLGIATPVAAMKLVAATQEPPAAPTPPPAPRAPEAPRPPHAPVAPEAPLPPAPLDIDIPDVPDVPDVSDVPDVAAVVDGALSAVLPQIPTIVASAVGAYDPARTEAALYRAQVEMRRSGRSRAEIDAAMREARQQVREAQAQARRVQRTEMARARRESQRAMVHARVALAAVPQTVALAMASGASGMENGAARMEEGAQRMEEAGRRLQTDSAYREREIARARARGDTVTHEQLIDAGEDMEEGAEGMREGAREMREAAQRMRRGETH